MARKKSKKEIQEAALLDKYKRQFESFLKGTDVAREVSTKCRDYYNNIQWTEEEEAIIKSRGQAPIVYNRVKPKVGGLLGLLVQQNTDPKALPVTPAHEKASEAITDRDWETIGA